MLEYTLHVEELGSSGNVDHNSLAILGNNRMIEYQLTRVNSKYSEFEVEFSPLVVDLDLFEVNYYVIESN